MVEFEFKRENKNKRETKSRIKEKAKEARSLPSLDLLAQSAQLPPPACPLSTLSLYSVGLPCRCHPTRSCACYLLSLCPMDPPRQHALLAHPRWPANALAPPIGPVPFNRLRSHLAHTLRTPRPRHVPSPQPPHPQPLLNSRAPLTLSLPHSHVRRAPTPA
jgi:hypothetical protein